MKALKLIAIGSLLYSAAYSQEKIPAASNGYWVVEGNLKNKKEQVVKFYNQRDQLIYRETVPGHRLNIMRPKVQTLLNNSLNTVLAGNFSKDSLVIASAIK